MTDNIETEVQRIARLKKEIEELAEALEAQKNSQLEIEFLAAVEAFDQESGDKLDQAAKLLREVCELSEKHGVPFDSRVSFLSQSYSPRSFTNKFGDLDQDIIDEHTGVYMEFHGDGWEHSQVC